MRRYEAEQKAQDEYGNLRLKYEVKDVPYMQKATRNAIRRWLKHWMQWACGSV